MNENETSSKKESQQIKGANLNNFLKDPPQYVKILIIVGIAISIISIIHTFNDTKRDNENRTKQVQEWKEEMSALKFNCPYCKSYNSIKQKDIHGNSVVCHNCRRWLNINWSTGTVTLDSVYNR